jgi:hypothetical protein
LKGNLRTRREGRKGKEESSALISLQDKSKCVRLGRNEEGEGREGGRTKDRRRLEERFRERRLVSGGRWETLRSWLAWRLIDLYLGGWGEEGRRRGVRQYSSV